MDMSFADLKKEAANTADNIFGHTADAAKQVSYDLLGGQQDDNAHTEHYFANEQKDPDFEHIVDPQTFVQRMSAGAKEAQEQLDAKFSQQTNDYNDFLGDATKDLENFGNKFSQGISSLTTDFMNAERGGGGNGKVNNNAGVLFGEAGDLSKNIKLDDEPSSVPQPPISANISTTSLIDDDNYGYDDGQTNIQTPLAAAKNYHDDIYDKPISTTNIIAQSKDSDTDSPSVSYNPSPVKKPIVDALKEQDNDKFISSEDLLGDFKDDRTATPDNFQIASGEKLTSTQVKAAATSVPTTDLDADDDFINAGHDDDFANIKNNFTSAPTPTPIPAAQIQKPVIPINESQAPKLQKTEPTPLASMKPAPIEVKKPTPAAKPAAAAAASFVDKDKNLHPNVIYVEEIFYKYGLDAWFKPDRLHPRVESLIYWRDVQKSGIIFGAGLILLLAISCFSVISVFAYASLLVLAGTIAFRIYKTVMQAVQKTSDGHPFKEYLDIDLTLSQEKIQNIAGVAVAHVNGFTAELRRLFLVEDLVDSIKFGVILWVLTFIGAWFNGMTLVILAFVSLFTLPKVYENNKQSIDTYLDLVRSKLTEITDRIKLALPIVNKKPVAAETDKDK